MSTVCHPGLNLPEGQGQFISITCLVKDFTKGKAEVTSASMGKPMW